MPRKIETTVYTYNELSPRAQEKARAWYRSLSAGDTDFAEFVTDDFHTTLKALGFDPFVSSGRYLAANDPRARRSTVAWSGFWSQGDGAAFSGTWRAADCKPEALLANRPTHYDEKGVTVPSRENQELHRIAAELLACKAAGLEYASITKSNRGYFMSLDDYRMDDDSDDALDNEPRKELEERFITAARDLAHAFYKALEAEYEYQNSDEVVEETIIANEYEFTEEGERA